MSVIKYDEINLKQVQMENADGASGINVIGPYNGWENHTLRLFRLKPGGYTPRHQHDWEHINVVLGGRGRLRIGENIHELSERDFAFVPPNTEHQFENPYESDFEFVCIVPNRGAVGIEDNEQK